MLATVPWKAGYRLAAFGQTGSTNSEAMQAARAGERGPMWFVTTEQTAGRGRRQRPWIAPRGNLASSILEVMDVTPAVAATNRRAAASPLTRRLARSRSDIAVAVTRAAVVVGVVVAAVVLRDPDMTAVAYTMAALLSVVGVASMMDPGRARCPR